MFIVPSRSRPHNVHRLARSTGTPPFLLMLDYNDPLLDGYFPLPRNWQYRINARKSLSEIYNAAFQEFPDLDWYGIFADDVTPETEGWATALITAAGSDGLAYGDDGIGMPTHFVLGGDLVRETGWLALPGLQRLYIDTVWADITKAKGVFRYLPDVKVTHRHPSVGKSLMDKTYRKQGKLEDAALYESSKLSDLYARR